MTLYRIHEFPTFYKEAVKGGFSAHTATKTKDALSGPRIPNLADNLILFETTNNKPARFDFVTSGSGTSVTFSQSLGPQGNFNIVTVTMGSASSVADFLEGYDNFREEPTEAWLLNYTITHQTGTQANNLGGGTVDSFFISKLPEKLELAAMNDYTNVPAAIGEAKNIISLPKGKDRGGDAIAGYSPTPKNLNEMLDLPASTTAQSSDVTSSAKGSIMLVGEFEGNSSKGGDDLIIGNPDSWKGSSDEDIQNAIRVDMWWDTAASEAKSANLNLKNMVKADFDLTDTQAETLIDGGSWSDATVGDGNSSADLIFPHEFKDGSAGGGTYWTGGSNGFPTFEKASLQNGGKTRHYAVPKNGSTLDIN